MFIDLQNVFNTNDFNYDKLRKCYRAKIKDAKINFNINSNRNDFHMLAIKI